MILVLVRIPLTLLFVFSLSKAVRLFPQLSRGDTFLLLGYALAGAVLLTVLWAPVIGQKLSDRFISTVNFEISLPPVADYLVQMIRRLQGSGWNRLAILLVFIEGVRHPNLPHPALLGLLSARPGSFLEKCFAREVLKFSNIQNCLYAYKVLTQRHGIIPSLHQYPELNLAIPSLNRKYSPEPPRCELKSLPPLLAAEHNPPMGRLIVPDGPSSQRPAPLDLIDGSVHRSKPNLPNHGLLRCIGSGSFGEVWLARNIMGTFRAVKVVYRRNFSDERPYEREFRGLQRFEPISRSHDGFVDILDTGLDAAQGCFYYVMELADDVVSGSQIDPESYEARTLDKELSSRGYVPVQMCASLGVSLSAALGYLHQHGLLHRDIKPSNIIFVNGIPKIADIGLVANAQGTTFPGGTSGYFPSEGPGTVQADIYALGKVLYELSTGLDRCDFPDLPAELSEMQDPDQFREFNQIILKACEDDPRKRYQKAQDLHADLCLLMSGKTAGRFGGLEKGVTRLIQVCTSRWT
jgi:hypothetical protein